MNIVYIGSAGVLSELPLRVLLQRGVNITAVALLESSIDYLQSLPPTLADIKVGSDETLSSSASLLEIAAQQQIPVVPLSLPLEKSALTLANQSVDLIVMSCFPRLLPAAIYNLPKYGCFNLHPSLLPAYRGPSPVHWQCEHKVAESGVTIHQVNAAFDEGDIALQKKIKTRQCVNKLELAYKLALLGGEALVELVQQVTDGQLSLQAQAETEASYYGFPS